MNSASYQKVPKDNRDHWSKSRSLITSWLCDRIKVVNPNMNGLVKVQIWILIEMLWGIWNVKKNPWIDFAAEIIFGVWVVINLLFSTEGFYCSSTTLLSVCFKDDQMCLLKDYCLYTTLSLNWKDYQFSCVVVGFFSFFIKTTFSTHAQTHRLACTLKTTHMLASATHYISIH